MLANIKLIVLLAATLSIGCAGVEPGESIEPSEPGDSTVRPERDAVPDIKGDSPSLVDPNCLDTAPAPAPMINGLGPTARITSMQLPTSIRAATEMGCPLVAGSKGGQGLTALMRVMEIDVDTLVNPDADGVIPSIILGHLAGWDVGQSGNQTSNLDLRMYTGTGGAGDTFGIDPASMNPNGQTRVHFPATVGCQALETETARIDFAVPVEDAEVPLTLEAAQVSGKISVDETGFNLTEGRIVGYVPIEAIVSIVSGIQAACGAPNAPMACDNAEILLSGDAEEITRTLVLPFLFGLDAQLSPDLRSASSCHGDACNAMSVCIAFEANSVNVEQL